jgi:hypothetical protein
MNAIELSANDEGIVTATLAGRDVWRYNHQPVAAGQPCFHPVNTPAGYTISLLSAWDHVHHTGLWFAWKLIDGLNAWEGPAYPPYETRITPTGLAISTSAFTASYAWHAQDGRLLLTGKVTCDCASLDDSAYAIDLVYEFSTPAGEPVLLDRNLPPTAGYAGLSFRTIREFRHGLYIDAEGQTTPPARGTPSAWHAFSGPIDGGPKRKGGCALMDHPNNLRYPAPTYTIHEEEAFSFLQYAFLYDEPYLLQPGEPLHLRYRVAIFDGDVNADNLQKWFDSFALVSSE